MGFYLKDAAFKLLNTINIKKLINEKLKEDINLTSQIMIFGNKHEKIIKKTKLSKDLICNLSFD